MTSNTPLHLAAALDGAGWHPAAWREPNSHPDALFTGAYWTDLAAVAQRGLLDFVTIEDSLAAPVNRHPPDAADSVDRVRARIDAHLVAARIAPLTRHLGLIPTITTTHTEPFHVSKGIATLDYTSRGRAGWQVKVSGHADEAAHFGRRTVPELTEQDWAAIAEGTLPQVLVDLFDEAGDFVEVVRRLWDSWEDGAEIRDVETRRFIDRDKLHYIDFEGRYFSVRGPSITPRPPQGQPVVTALAHQALPYELAARGADLVFVTPADDVHAQSVLADVAAASERVGRTGEPLRVYADLVVFLDNDRESGAARLHRLDGLAGIEFASDAAVFTGSADELADRLAAWQQLGFDGFRLRPGVAVDDLDAVSSRLVPILQQRGLFRTAYPDTSLRGLLGLPTDVPNRYATGTPAA
ncbi:LLM class flavin-dependent oxidoreductase [Rhodococcus koreensis]|uniref:Flavin-dependent oxidoreductase, luciferase family (Includes alkanesulfonate monooxygenase SsuD and methylene tetrahydromethanopterin reductase) n=1 Tax=Rhodococcus koreensis TaxID=99653 RepID=A0A1H5BVL4_9NOCA|nr:LLM class flavin-dependent oxidoreductase [Rhodococcus koreensis]SED58241.1 Flavin-dependent oxidoreductase, luciferase family (includes alkanesulfonate monooxygenase SsuD and methylene tetrahydromethanopterin reductase) [Rhodococcus koreensis]